MSAGWRPRGPARRTRWRRTLADRCWVWWKPDRQTSMPRPRKAQAPPRRWRSPGPRPLGVPVVLAGHGFRRAGEAEEWSWAWAVQCEQSGLSAPMGRRLRLQTAVRGKSLETPQTRGRFRRPCEEAARSARSWAQVPACRGGPLGDDLSGRWSHRLRSAGKRLGRRRLEVEQPGQGGR